MKNERKTEIKKDTQIIQDKIRNKRKKDEEYEEEKTKKTKEHRRKQRRERYCLSVRKVSRKLPILKSQSHWENRKGP